MTSPESVSSLVRKLAKEPLVQFLLIGVCIYAAYAWVGTADEEPEQRTVYISQDRIDSLAAAWKKRWNRSPTDRELVGLVRAFLREDILYREATAMGLDVDDHIVRRRLAQKLEFLTTDLVQLTEPADGELEAFFAERQDRFKAPDRISFVHVYFNPDARGDATLEDAASALARLQAGNHPVSDAQHEGDRFMLQGRFSRASELDIRRALGSGFAEAVMQLQPGEWHGPVLSGFGPHLVYVQESMPAPEPRLDDVREAVLDEWRRARTEQFNEEFLAGLKSRYEIVIDGPAPFVSAVLGGDDAGDSVAIPDGVPGQ